MPHHKQKEQSSPLFAFDEDVFQEGHQQIAGVDEAGRGPLAGPVVAAACYIPQGVDLQGIDDSKRLTPEARHRFFEQLTQDPRIQYGVGIVSAEIIDQINILQATIQAMLEAVAALHLAIDYLLVDGLALPHQTIPCRKVIKGDQKSLRIAAASIIAKESRDRMMRAYAEEWPAYGFAKHKGYGTRGHIEKIAQYGPSPIHRLTFEPLKSMFIPQEANGSVLAS